MNITIIKIFKSKQKQLPVVGKTGRPLING